MLPRVDLAIALLWYVALQYGMVRMLAHLAALLSRSPKTHHAPASASAGPHLRARNCYEDALFCGATRIFSQKESILVAPWPFDTSRTHQPPLAIPRVRVPPHQGTVHLLPTEYFCEPAAMNASKFMSCKRPPPTLEKTQNLSSPMAIFPIMGWSPGRVSPSLHICPSCPANLITAVCMYVCMHACMHVCMNE